MPQQNAVEVVLNGFDRTTAAFASATGNLQKFQTLAAGVAKTALAIGAAFEASMVAVVKRSVDAGDQLYDLSLRTGASVENLSRLSNVGKLSKTSLEDIASAAKHLNRSLSEAAANANSDAGRALAAMGLSATDASGRLKTVDQAFVDLSTRFSQYQDGPNKVALALTLMGRAGDTLIPMLDDVDGKLRDLASQKPAFTTEQAEAAHEFEKSLIAIDKAIGTFQNGLAKALLPTLQVVAQQLEEQASAFAKTQSDIDAVSNAFKVLLTVVYAVWNGFRTLANLMAGTGMAQWIAMRTAVEAFWTALKALGTGILETARAVVELVKSLGGLGEVFTLMASGKFMDAFNRSKVLVGDVADKIVDVGKGIKDVFITPTIEGAKVVERGAGEVVGVMSGMWDDMIDQGADFILKMDAIWNASQNPLINPDKAKNKGKGLSPRDQPAPIPAPNPEEANKLLDELLAREAEGYSKLSDMEDQFRIEQVQGSQRVLAQVDNEYVHRLQQIDDLFIDEQSKNEAMAEAYAAQEQQLNELHRTGALFRADLDRAYAEGNLANIQKLLQSEQALAEARRQDAQEFGQTWSKVVRDSQLSWVRFMTEAASTFSQGLSRSLTQMVLHANEAGKAVKALGNAMLEMVVNFVTRWIAAQLTMRIFGAAMTGIVAGQAALIGEAWTVPAALASLATLGGNAALADAAIAETIGFAQAASFLGGVAHGGLDYVPAEKTFLLKEGERVLQPSANRDLTEFLANQQSAGPSVIMIHLDGEVIARGVTRMSRDGRLVIHAKSIV